VTRADLLVTQKLTAFGAVAITLIVTPWVTTDPINLPKLLALAVVAACASLACMPLIRQKASQVKMLASFLVVYLFWLISIFIFAPGWKVQQLFGTEGRNTGLIAYLSFVALFISTVLIADRNLLALLWKSLLFVGSVSLFYGFMQSSGFDPAPWINPDNPIIGFLGNSNFQSSLLGVCVSLVLPSIFQKSMSKKRLGAYIFFICLAILQVALSDSIQGAFVAAAGFSTLILVKTYKSKFHWALPYLIVILAINVVLVFLALINVGPFAKFFFTKSIMARYEYWNAAIKMTSDHPFFGVGLDSFGDWYLRSRTLDAMLRRDVMTDSAHNVFLDQFANGGLVLGVLYLLMHLIVLRSIFRLVQRGSLDVMSMGFICAWVGFVAQSLISISQIGLAVWGWIISGLIVGLDVGHKFPVVVERNQIKRERNESISARLVVLLPAGIILGIMSTFAPITSDTSYYKALNSGSVSDLTAASEKFGASSKTQLRIAAIFSQNSLHSESLTVATRLVSRNSEEFNAWLLIYSNPMSNSELKVTALNNMRRLEPNKKDF